MTYRLVLKKTVLKFLSSRTPKEKTLIKQKFELLRQTPTGGPGLDVKRLIHDEPLYRLRIGKFRFIYQFIDEELVVLMEKADGRGDVYKGI